MTVNEYITMDLILPLAGGLAGAALYHLGTAFFRYIFDVEAYDPKNVMHLDGWARQHLMTADAVANVRLNALEERVGEWEETTARLQRGIANSDLSCYNAPEQKKAVPYGSQVPEKVPPLTLHNSSVGGLPDWIEYCGTKYYAR